MLTVFTVLPGNCGGGGGGGEKRTGESTIGLCVHFHVSDITSPGKEVSYDSKLSASHHLVLD